MNTYQVKSKAWDIATIGIMIAVIEVCKVTLSFLPNIELTAFLIIMFTLYFGRKTLFAIPAFIIIEILIYGFNIFWVTAYFYTWPLLFLLTLMMKRSDSLLSFALLSGFFGLAFGLLCSLPYIFIGSESIRVGIRYAIGWWIAGIPWDIIHGVSNFVIMLVLYKPVSRVLERVVKE